MRATPVASTGPGVFRTAPSCWPSPRPGAAGCVSHRQVSGSGLGLLVSAWYKRMAVQGSRPRLSGVGTFWNVLECRAACLLC